MNYFKCMKIKKRNVRVVSKDNWTMEVHVHIVSARKISAYKRILIFFWYWTFSFRITNLYIIEIYVINDEVLKGSDLVVFVELKYVNYEMCSFIIYWINNTIVIKIVKYVEIYIYIYISQSMFGLFKC